MGNFPLHSSLQPYQQESRSRRGRQGSRWQLGVVRQSSSQRARDEHQLQMMELRANENGNGYAPFDGRPGRNLINERPRDQKLGENLGNVRLRVGGKRSSGGIRDDESILCPTPPNRESAGYELGPQYMGHGARPHPAFIQPINFTVNVNNAGPHTTAHGVIHPGYGPNIGMSYKPDFEKFDKEKEKERE